MPTFAALFVVETIYAPARAVKLAHLMYRPVGRLVASYLPRDYAVFQRRNLLGCSSDIHRVPNRVGSVSCTTKTGLGCHPELLINFLDVISTQAEAIY